jgi:hypothetical protein
MVTDIMDKEEPLRNKLRILGANIISDTHVLDKGQALYNQIYNRISEVLSFMEIASSVGIISEMNSSILINEFMELRKSIIEVSSKKEENWLQEFMKEGDIFETNVQEREVDAIGQINTPSQFGTRIGVQSGGTLMKALSEKISVLPKINRTNTNVKISTHIHNIGTRKDTIDVLKNKRHEDIILVIKDKMKNSQNFDGVTITDIKSQGQGSLISCGEKTLQRELVSMVSSGLLKKTGEKRWSRYSLK